MTEHRDAKRYAELKKKVNAGDTNKYEDENGNINHLTEQNAISIETIDGREFPEEIGERVQWMNTLPDEKYARNPFEADSEIAFKWKKQENYNTLPTVLEASTYNEEAEEYFSEHPMLVIQDEENPVNPDVSGNILLIDFDNAVVDGEVHPDVMNVINGISDEDTYVEVSQSGNGIHVLLYGQIPTDHKSVEFLLPAHKDFTGASVEIYDTDRLCKVTGNKLKDASNTLDKVNPEPLERLINAHVDQPKEEKVRDYNPEDYEPSRTREELERIPKTSDYSDILDAIHQITPSDLRLKSSYQEQENSNTESWNPAYRTSDSGLSLKRFKDTGKWIDMKLGDEDGFSILSLLAAELGTIKRPNDRLEGANWKETVQAAREMGAPIPKFVDEPPANFFIHEILVDDGIPEAGISQKELYERTRRHITESMESGDSSVLDAIMGSGKTFNSIGVLNDMEEKGAYFTTRNELYVQGEQYALANGIDHDLIYILPSLFADCDSMPNSGEEPENKREEVGKFLFDMGVMPAKIHSYLHENFNMDCCHAEEEECTYKQKTAEEKEDYQLLIGHHKHSYIPENTKNRHCIFDEDPHDTFSTKIEGSTLIKSVNSFCSSNTQFEFDGWNDLLAGRNDSSRAQNAMSYLQEVYELNQRDDEGTIKFEKTNTGQYHALTPQAIVMVLTSEELADGANFEDSDMIQIGGNTIDEVLDFQREETAEIESGIFFTSSESKGMFYVELNTVPNLDYADSITALDGTPFVHPNSGRPVEWQNALGTTLNHQRILTDEERKGYIYHELKHKIYQTSEHIKPYSSGKYNNPIYDQTIASYLYEETGVAPILFSSKKVVEEYDDWSFIDDSDYWGNLRGSDAYGERRSALLLGSAHHGDHELRRRAAHLGVALEPEGKGVDRTYGNEVGDALYQHMAEATTAQTAMRVGRDGEGATIFIDTCMIPDYMPIEGKLEISERIGVEEQIRTAWKQGSHTPREVAEWCDTSLRQVRRGLNQLTDQGLLSKEDHPEDGRKNQYKDAGLTEVAAHSPKEVVGPDIESIIVYTSNVRIDESKTTLTHVLSDSTGEVSTDGGDVNTSDV